MPLYKDEMAALTPAMPKGVKAMFTLREGGVSSGPWGNVDGIMGLNVGTHVQDNAGCVRMNRSIVAQLTPTEPKWMTQVHGIKVLDAETITDDSVEADAATSVTPGVVCVAQVADCLPVLVAEVNGRGVAAIHAGWKGLAAGVIEEGVNRLRERLGDPSAELKAWLGPRIGFDDFETGRDVYDAYQVRYSAVTEAYRDLGEGKFKVDLAGVAKVALRNVGVSDVEDCGFSTVTDPTHFYSFRRDGARSGRHAALIWIEPKE